MSLNKWLITVLCLYAFSHPVGAQKLVIYQCPIEIDHSNDQGEMSSSDYLRNYGTKGKTRTLEYLHEILKPFVKDQLIKAGYELLPFDTLSSVKANVYGCPNLNIKKATEAIQADQYLRIFIKDIGMVNQNQTDPFQQQKKEVNIRCRIQLHDADRNLIKEVEGFFKSGDPISHPELINVDLRQFRSDPYMQEIKIYEICCKMSILNALAKME